jgi:cyanophycinase
MNGLLVIWLYLSLVTVQAGPLVIVGGGAIPVEVRQAFVDSAGGDKSIIAILPQASQRADRGKRSVDVFLHAGAAEAYVVELDDAEEARKKISHATGIWFPGGSQSDLYDALEKAGLLSFVRQRHQAGITIGGTSAGAAIMSEIMIPTSPKKPGLLTGNTPTTMGLGLAPQLIIDQHFVERSRMNRLLSAVIDHPDRIGVGIGESTAIVLRGGKFTVLGAGSVVVFDARKAKVERKDAGALQSSSDLRVHVLRAKQEFDM